MTKALRKPKDKNYNLIAVLYQSSDNVESLKPTSRTPSRRATSSSWSSSTASSRTT